MVYIFIYRFCLESNYSHAQCQLVMETIQTVFFECVFSIADGTAEGTIAKFKSELKSKLRSKDNVPILSVPQVKEFSEFFSTNLIKNFVAYQYVCNEDYNEIEIVKNIPVATPLIPVPLALGEEV